VRPAIKMIEEIGMGCNFCGSDDCDIVAQMTRFEKNNVLKCRNCRLVYLEHKQSKAEIESFYSSTYRKRECMQILSPEEHFHHKVSQDDAKKRISFITKNIDIVNKRILEVGSAASAFWVMFPIKMTGDFNYLMMK